MSIADLRTLAKSIGTTGEARRPRAPLAGGVTAAPGIEVSEYEAQRVKAYADKRKPRSSSGGTPRTEREAMDRYLGHREQQLRGAKTDDQVKRLGRRVEEGHVMLSATGRLVMPRDRPGEARSKSSASPRSARSKSSA
jgi:hypothetical protein